MKINFQKLKKLIFKLKISDFFSQKNKKNMELNFQNKKIRNYIL